MKRVIISIISLCLILDFFLACFDTLTVNGSTGSTASEMNHDASAYSENELLITFSSVTTNKEIKEIANDHDVRVDSISSSGDDKFAKIEVERGADLGETISELNDVTEVKYVQPNYNYHIQTTDPLYNDNQQYQFKQSRIKSSWDLIKTNGKSQTTKVAVIDTGVDADHEDLTNALTSTYSYRRYINGVITSEPDDSGNHGTHVAGIIGATFGNGKGGAGVASGENNDYSKILPIGASKDGETLTTYDVIQSIKYAYSQGAQVINLSLGCDYRDRLLGAEIKDKYNSGVTFVAAAGNENTDYDNNNGGSNVYKISYPSDMKEVISVCNVNKNGQKSSSSNYGVAKDISAAGTGILSSLPNNKYGSKTGTSMSSPVVSGVVALMLDADPTLTPTQIRNIICATADTSSTNSNYYRSNELGYGIIDAYSALRKIYEGDHDTLSSIEIKDYYDTSKKHIVYTESPSSAYADDRGYPLEALITPAYYDSKTKITWSSSDESIATVDNNGIVTGKKKGNCYISVTAKLNGSTVTDSIEITVRRSVDPNKLILSNYPTELEAGSDTSVTTGDGVETYIDAAIEPSNATNGEVYWTSSNNNIAFVDDTGIVYALSEGKCRITASTYNGKTAFFDLTVTGNSQDPSSSAAISQSSSNASSSSSPSDSSASTTVSVSTSSRAKFTKQMKIKAKAKKTKKAVVSFKQQTAKITTKTTKTTKTKSTGKTISKKSTDRVTKNKKSVKYQIAVLRPGTKKWKKFTVPAKKRKNAKYQIKVKGNKVTLIIKKVAGKKLRKGKKYQFSVRPVIKVDSKNYYGSWSKARKIKIK